MVPQMLIVFCFVVVFFLGCSIDPGLPGTYRNCIIDWRYK